MTKFRQDPDSNSRAGVDNRDENNDKNPLSAAEEAYANRAYPADEIPFDLTLGAQAAFNQVKARGVGQGKNTPGQWTLIGPSTANYPAILTFSGHDYTTSGRITALAIALNCTTTKCRLWVGAAGGSTFSMIWNSAGSVRGVNQVALDPSTPTTVYAAAFQMGVWRLMGGGAFTQIKTALNPTLNTDRAEFATALLPNGKTRIYVGIGNQGFPSARLYRTDDATAPAPVFADITTPAVLNYCTGQCWYDNYVVSPAGYPDIIYVGGSYQYGEYGGISNSRGVVLSTDAGATFTDMSWDASSDTTPNGQHPDHHALVASDANPFLFFAGSDGGLMRSSGDFADQSAVCALRGLSGANLTFCQGLLSRVPKHLFTLNKGLSTLQFQSLSANAFDPKNLMGGTQDNGTFQYGGSAVVWPQIIYGDGGQSGFSSSNPALRFNTFTGQANDVNFQNGDPTKWVIATGPIYSSPESALFYPPIIADPNPTNGGTIFQGSQSVWRTQDWGGNQAYLEANCPEFTASAANPACGDFVRIGPASATNLTASATVYRLSAWL